VGQPAENLQKAVELQLLSEETGHTGNDRGALDYFGVALHAVADSTSPWHRDNSGKPLVWNGTRGFGALLGAAGHGIAETVWGDLAEGEKKHEAVVGALQLWQDYQSKLKKARKAKCGDQGPGKTEKGHPYLGPPTQTANACEQ